MKNKIETWKFIVQTIIAVLTAIATSLGVASCMNCPLSSAELPSLPLELCSLATEGTQEGEGQGWGL